MHAELVVTSEGAADRRYTLRIGQTFVVGRADDVTVRILDDRAVSRRHASFELRADGVFVQDLGSRNGTQLDGDSLQPRAAPTLAQDGAQVAIGTHVVRVRLVDAQPDGAGGAATARLGLPQVPREEYELLGLIGRGATGRVYAAVQKLMRRRVAIKVLSDELGADPTERERFLRQGWISTRIASPYVAQVYDVRIAGGRVLLIMELVEGPSLLDRLKDGALPLREALRIAQDVACALAAAAKVGVVHRDVKPSNILLAPEGLAKLVDFGIAKALGVADLAPAQWRRDEAPGPEATPHGPGALGVTPIGEGLGTLAYMAPEQAVEACSADTRSDIYALGATLYHMLTGSSPHMLLSCEQPELLRLLREGAGVPDLRSITPDCPQDVASIVHALLARDPAARPERAAEVGRRIEVLRRRHCPADWEPRDLTSTEG